MVGQAINHYKVLEKIGEGGMGKVYLAEDSRLDRKVALKILPHHLFDRAELRERFEREARAVSSLNHPHIGTLHDIGEQDGIHFVVMEHLEGETLSARLEKGPLPLEQTLEYAIQIADALDMAHRQGVVHRNFRPSNIMLTKSGAKLLDLGLAKLQAAEKTTKLSALSTEQASLSAERTILGTLQYMAPEQLEGKEADSRTDIFAFGAVVYEMATGKKAFEGKSQTSLIAAIMKKDPRPMSELSTAPPTLDHLIRGCLSKDPEDRWPTAHDVVQQLKWWMVEGGAQPTRVVPSAGVSGWRQSITVGLSVVVGVLLVALLGIGFGSLTSSNSPSMKRFPIQTPVDQQLGHTSTADAGDVAGSPTAANGEDPAARQALQSTEQIDKPALVAANQSDSTDVERSSAPTEQSATNQLGSTSTRGVGFAVQIAACRTRQNAEKSRTLWEGRGYTAYVIETDIPGAGLYYRVRVGRLDTQEEAREVASNMQRRFPQELPDFWIVPYQQ